MRKNKAMLDDFVPLILAMIIVFIAFISCTPLQRKAQNIIERDVSGYMMNIDADQFLLNYLTQEVETSNGKMTFSDLITLSHKKDDFKEWKELTQEFLDKYKPQGHGSWNIKLYELPSEKKIVSVGTHERILFEKTRGESTAIISGFDTDKQIKIRLYKTCQEGTC